MTTPLSPSGVSRALEKLRDHISPLNYRRLEQIAMALGEDGRVLIEKALEVASTDSGTPLKDSAFREFRSTMSKAAAEVGISFSLEADRRRSEWAYFSGQDPLTEELAIRSEKEARTGLPEKTVNADASVPGPHRIYFSGVFDERNSLSDAARELIDRLTTQLRTTMSKAGVEFSASNGAPLGSERQAYVERSCSDADLIIVFLSPEYLLPENAELDAVLRSRRILLPVTLSAVASSADMRNLERAHVRWEHAPWERQTDKEKDKSISDLAAAIHQLLSREPNVTPRLSCVERLDRHARRIATRLGAQEVQVASRALVGGFDPTGSSWAGEEECHMMFSPLTEEQATPERRHVSAVPRLLEWATAGEEEECRFAAVLGDVGAGKSTALKQVTLHLLDERKKDPSLPLPILFDLRELNGQNVDLLGARDLIDALLRRTQGIRDTATGEEVLELAEQGNCVFLFDGLDEALVHLSPAQGQRLVQRLWQIAGGNPATKLLISCRTHFFRTLRDETSTFLSQGREDVKVKDYLVLHMLPFTQDQIREYLRSNVGEDRVNAIMSMIGSVYNLSELATQPMLLKMIVAVLEPLQKRVMEGHGLRSVDLYESFVLQWLARDDGKHQLIPDHKILLMENLAERLWKEGKRTWQVQDLENWMLRFMRDNPDLELHYEKRLPDLWKEDLRTATFVTRSGDDYGFAHTSLLEYFLARHMFRLLQAGADRAVETWSNLSLSSESQRFLIESLLGLSEKEREKALDTLRSIARDHRAGPSVIRFVASALPMGLPVRNLAGINLAGAELDGICLESLVPLSLAEADFSGSSVRRCRFRGLTFDGADFSSTDLTATSFVDCVIRRTVFESASLNGTVFRLCFWEANDLRSSSAHGAQIILSEGVVIEGADTAPASTTDWPLPVTLAGHVGRVLGGVFSPDGLSVLTTGADGSARVWDVGTGRCVHVLKGHIDWVRSGVFSPDGLSVLTTGADGSARVWDVGTGRCVHVLEGHSGGVFGGVFSPDGLSVLTTGADGFARVWDVGTGRCVHVLEGHSGGVFGGVFSPDGLSVLTTGADGFARVWDVGTGRCVHVLKGHTGRVFGGVFSPDGLSVLTTGADGSARVWDVGTGRCVHVLKGHIDWVRSGVFSPDGLSVLTTGADGSVRVWDVGTGRCVHVLEGHTGGVFSPDGLSVLTTGVDRSARVWDVGTGRCVHVLEGHTGRVLGGVYSPDGLSVLTTGVDRSARVWDVGTGRCVHVLEGHTGRVFGGVFSPDGLSVLTTGVDRFARVWDVGTGRCVHVLEGHIDWVRSGVFSPDGLSVLTTGADGSVRVWDVGTGRCVHVLEGHTGGVFSPDGLSVLTTGADGSVRVWDVGTGRCVHVLKGHTGRVLGGVFSPDGLSVLTVSDDRSARVWDVGTGRCVHVLKGHTGRVLGGVFSPDGLSVLTTGVDRSARVWDVGTGRCVHVLKGHIDWVRSGVFSPDGLSVLTVSADRSVRVWDVGTGRCVHVLKGHTGGVFGGVFSPDGLSVLTTGADGSVRVWDVGTGRCVHVLEGHSGGVFGGVFSPDGLSVLTTGADGSVRVWDVGTGQQTGKQFDFLPEGEVVVRDGCTQQVLGASDGAWRWLGITVLGPARPHRLPAEMGGRLPSLEEIPPLESIDKVSESPAT